MQKKFIPIILMIVVIVIFYYYKNYYRYISTDNARIKMANIQVISETSGYIKELKIQDNQKVNKNDILLKINDEQYEMEYKKNVALHGKAKKNYEFNKKEFNKQNKLYKQQFISESEVNKINTAYNLSKYDLEALQETMNLSKYKLDKTTIVAQNSGVIANFNLKNGDFINAGRPLFNIIDTNDIWIETNFKEIDTKDIKINQFAEVEVDAFPGTIWYAKVIGITPATGAEFALLPAQNTSSNWIKVVQRVNIKLAFIDKNNLDKLKSGLSAEVKIKVK